MARIFLSHSSLNSTEAVVLRDWLSAAGWSDIFLDLDPGRGIAAGERWERALYEAANRCEAVLFLVSRAWLASRWCLKELQLAQKLNKRLFGLLIEDLPLGELPAELTGGWQVVHLASGVDHRLLSGRLPSGEVVQATFSAGGLDRLRGGLVKAGLDPRFFAWPPPDDPERPPYRGLLPLEAEDAGIFFGREAPIVAVLDQLRGLRDAAPPRAVVILGASGSGKSSFLRAGLIARLARDDRTFLPLPIVRAERAALTGKTGLLAALEQALRGHSLSASRASLKEALSKGAAGLLPVLQQLAQRAQPPALPGEAPAKAPALILAVDQAEELFLAEGAVEAAALLQLLCELALAPAPAVILLFTIRSDAFEQLQSAPALDRLALETFSLPPLPRGAYQQVIEGPALRLQESRRPLRIEPALTQRLLTDIETGGGKDALPLLAFTLQRLYLEYGGDGDLRLDEYEAMAGIAGSIEAAVEGALQAADGDSTVPTDRDQRLALLRRALIPWLAGIDPTTGAPRRRVARLSEIPPETRPLVRHLIDQRLLATDVAAETGEVTLEPAHESLLRQWGLLQDWLEQDFAALTALEGVQRATRDWAANAKDEAWLAHSAGRLEDAEALLRRDDLAAMLGPNARDYLAACNDLETKRKNWELAAARELAAAKTRIARRTLWGAAAAGVLALVAIGAAILAVNSQREAQQSAAAAAAQRTVADQQRTVAEDRKAEAIRNETVAFAALSRAAASEGHIADAVMLAVAAWPRPGDEGRPQMELVVRSLGHALPQQRELLRLDGHQRLLQSAMFSPDGEYGLTASADGTARLWDLSRGVTRAVLKGHADAVNSAVFSPNGSLVLTASVDRTARIWDTNGTLLVVFEGHADAISSAIFSPDGARVLTASDDKTARIWDTASGSLLGVLEGHGDWVASAVFSSDGKRVLTASRDKTARIWDAAQMTPLAVLEGHDGWVTGAVFSPDGARVATVSVDGSVRVWDAMTGVRLLVLEGHTAPILGVVFSADSALLLTASADWTARIWDPKSGTALAVLSGHGAAVTTAHFSRDGTRVLTASPDTTARIWDAGNGAPLAVLEGHDDWVTSAIFSPDGMRVLTASIDRSARLWTAASWVPIATMNGHAGPINSGVFSVDGVRVLTASDDKTARIWAAASGMELAVLEGHVERVTSAVFSPDSTLVLTASEDGTARIWEVASRRQLAVLEGHVTTVTDAAFSPDGTLVLTASEDMTARVWNVASSLPLAVLRGHVERVTSAVYSPDGTRVLTASYDKTARIWDADSGNPILILEGHADRVNRAVFSPDGARVLTVSDDGTGRIWDAAHGTPLAILKGHSSWVIGAAYSPDGTRVLTASADGTARIWDAASGAAVAVLGQGAGPLTSATFAPESNRLLTASYEGTARIWDISALEKGDAFQVACSRLGNNTDVMALAERYGLGEIKPICGEHAPRPVDLKNIQ